MTSSLQRSAENTDATPGIARLLRWYRQQANLTQIEAAADTGIAQPLLSRFENGRVVPSHAQADALLIAYGVRQETRNQLSALTREADTEHRRVAAYRPRASRVQREYAELERESFRVTTFHPSVVPGLLQTDEYARTLAAGELYDEALKAWLEARRARRALLAEPGREFVQIVTAGALLWGLGGPEVMMDQLARLVELDAVRGVSIGVVSPAAPANFAVVNGFDLYEREDQPPRVIVGTEATVEILDDPTDVAIYTELLEQLRDFAVWGEDARAVLTQLRKWYR